MLRKIESIGDHLKQIPHQIISTQEKVAINFLSGQGTFNDLRHQVFLEHTSPVRIAKFLQPFVTGLSADSENSTSALVRAKQLVQWWRLNSDHKPPQLIRELAQDLPPDEEGRMKRHEILGSLFTPYDFVIAVEDIARDVDHWRPQIAMTSQAFDVSVKQAMAADKEEDSSAVFQEGQRARLTASAERIIADSDVDTDDKVRLAQITVLAHRLSQKSKLSDSLIITALDLSEHRRTNRLSPDLLAGRLVALARARPDLSERTFFTMIQPIVHRWRFNYDSEVTNTAAQLCASLARIDQDAYAANQPDPRDVPDPRYIAGESIRLLSILFDENTLFESLRNISESIDSKSFQFTDDQVREASRLVRAIRIKSVDKLPYPAAYASNRASIQSILLPYLSLLSREADRDISSIILSMTPEGAENEIAPEVCDLMLHDKGHLGERAKDILIRRLEAKGSADTVLYLFRRIAHSPLNGQYNLWWQRVREILEDPHRGFVNYLTLNRLVGRLAKPPAQEKEVDPSTLAHYGRLASSILVSLNKREAIDDERGLRKNIELNSTVAAESVLTACINLDGHQINTINPLVYLVQDLSAINPMIVHNWRVRAHLERITVIIDETIKHYRREFVKRPYSDLEQMLKGTRDTIGTLLTSAHTHQIKD